MNGEAKGYCHEFHSIASIARDYDLVILETAFCHRGPILCILYTFYLQASRQSWFSLT